MPGNIVFVFDVRCRLREKSDYCSVKPVGLMNCVDSIASVLRTISRNELI